MDNFNTDTTSHILSGPLQEQDKRIQEAPTTVMSSTRPFKKRRIVTIKPDDVAALEQPRSACKGKKKKAQQPRTTKKPKKGFVSPSPPSSPVMVMKKSVTWNEQGGNIFHLQPDSCVNDGDLWYTREDYKEFLVDRLQTIKCHRDGNDSYSYCMRGLEIFQDDSTSEQFRTKKKLNHTIVKMEQVRQALLGTKEMERFHDLLKHQSNLALQRAQELAAKDQREIYPFRAYADAARDIRAVVSSYSNIEKISDLMKSVYGNTPPSDGNHINAWNTNTPNPVFSQQQKNKNFESHAESSGASVVSDVSSTTSSSSSESSSESTTNNSKSFFSDESIRKLQERSMRRLMGIYRNNNNDEGEGAEGVNNETNNLFRFAKRDSLLGISSPASNDTTKMPSQNSVWAATEEVAPSPQEQLLEILRHRQLLQDHHHQQQQESSSQDSTPSIQEQILDMVHRRQLLEERQQLEEERQQLQEQQERMQLQRQEQQHHASLEQEQLMEMVHRRQLMSEHYHQQQQEQRTSSNMGALGHGMGGHDSNSTSTNLIDEFLIQQQQHHQEHQNKMQLALKAMNASRFPIRRDTLSHVPADTTKHHDTASSMNHPRLPWNVTSMA